MLLAILQVCFQAAVVVLSVFVAAWVGLVGVLFPGGHAPVVVLAPVAGVVLQVEPEGKIWFEYSEVLQIIMGVFIDEPSTFAWQILLISYIFGVLVSRWCYSIQHWPSEQAHSKS